MSKFKAGDLALIIGSRHPDSQNCGRVVELVKIVQPGEEFPCPDGKQRRSGLDKAVWLVEADGLQARSIKLGWIDAGGICLIDEKYLMPLKGDFHPEQQKSREVEA